MEVSQIEHFDQDKSLQQIVSALGFRIAHSSQYSMMLSLFDKSRQRVWCVGKHKLARLGCYEFENYASLQRNLFNSIVSFKTAEKEIPNPYLGCKSLEEALVKKDLMSNGN